MLILLFITWLLISLKIIGSNWSTWKRNLQTGSFLFLLFAASGQLQAQTITEGLFQRDTTLSRTSSNGSNNRTVLLLDESIIQELMETQPEDITLPIPSDEMGVMQLVLKKQSLFSEDFKSNKNHLDSIGQKINLHYRGTVLDQPDSKVALSMSHKRVSGLIRLPSKKVFSIKRLLEDPSNKHVLSDYNDELTIGKMDCMDTDTMPKYKPIKLNRTTNIGEPVCVSIRVEVDQDFRGDVTALLNQVASIYQTINVDLKIAEIYYWDRPSPYAGTTKEIIQQIQTALRSQTGLTGDLTLFLGGKGNGGRAATVGSVCDPTLVCYSGQNNDVYTVAHELAHLFAAHHTHACKWNGNNTAIDGCGYNAGYGGCPEEDPLGGGTIMSYCHIRSVGINLEFHPQVASVIYNFLKDNSGCTCKDALVEEEVELELEEEISVDGGNENIIANICTMTFINPNNCAVEIHTLTNNIKGNLIATIDPIGSVNSPVIKAVNYGVYKDGILIDQFTAECGSVFSINSCGNEGNVVAGKVLLEGFYDSHSGSMRQTLLEQNLISKENPYLKAPWNYKGITSLVSIPSNVVDWILIMSRSAEGRIQGQSVGFVGKDGQLLDVYGNPGIPLVGANGQHISIHHRGHMAIMTSLPFQVGNVIDVTSTTASVMGNSQLKQIGKVYALHAGDYDSNGVINNMDYNHWVSNSSKINLYIPSDGDGNGVINNKDYNLWIANRSKIGHLPLHY